MSNPLRDGQIEKLVSVEISRVCRDGEWFATITCAGKVYECGPFVDEADAVMVCNEMARRAMAAPGTIAAPPAGEIN